MLRRDVRGQIRGGAIPLIGFGSAVVAIAILLIMVDPVVRDVEEIGRNHTTTSAQTQGIDWMMTIWSQMPAILGVVISLSLILSAVYLFGRRR